MLSTSSVLHQRFILECLPYPATATAATEADPITAAQPKRHSAIKDIEK
jgi:hypothetical protein